MRYSLSITLLVGQFKTCLTRSSSCSVFEDSSLGLLGSWVCFLSNSKMFFQFFPGTLLVNHSTKIKYVFLVHFPLNSSWSGQIFYQLRWKLHKAENNVTDVPEFSLLPLWEFCVWQFVAVRGQKVLHACTKTCTIYNLALYWMMSADTVFIWQWTSISMVYSDTPL